MQPPPIADTTRTRVRPSPRWTSLPSPRWLITGKHQRVTPYSSVRAAYAAGTHYSGLLLTRSRHSLHPPMPSSGVAKARVLYSVTQFRRPNDRSAATGIGSRDPDRNTRSRPVLPMRQSLAAQIAPSAASRAAPLGRPPDALLETADLLAPATSPVAEISSNQEILCPCLP